MICGLLFFAASVNYMDRQVIGLLKPTLQAQFGWTEIGYSNIVFAFTFAYGASLLVVGKLIDRIGTRKGFSFAVLFWSISAMAHAAAGSVFQFALARLSLGIWRIRQLSCLHQGGCRVVSKERTRARHWHF